MTIKLNKADIWCGCSTGDHENEYNEFIAAIDVSVAGKDELGDLRWHVDCSAINNIDDSLPEDYWAQALETAKMVLDGWRDFYPQLITSETTPQNDFEAAVLALRLAITAPDDERANECVQIALGLGLSELEMARAKRETLRQLEGDAA